LQGNLKDSCKPQLSAVISAFWLRAWWLSSFRNLW
jgi:hypothetical protein